MIPFWGTIIRTDTLPVHLWAQPLLGAVQPTPKIVMSDFACNCAESSADSVRDPKVCREIARKVVL